MGSLRAGKYSIQTYNNFCELHSDSSQFGDCSKSYPYVEPPIKEIKKKFKKRKHIKHYDYIETPHNQFFITEKLPSNRNSKSESKPKYLREQKPIKLTRKTSAKYEDLYKVTPSKPSSLRHSKEQKTTNLTRSTSPKWCLFKSKVKSISLFAHNSRIDVDKDKQPERLVKDIERERPVSLAYGRCERHNVKETERPRGKSGYWAQVERQSPCSMPSSRKEYWYSNLSSSSDVDTHFHSRKPEKVSTKTNTLHMQNKNNNFNNCTIYKDLPITTLAYPCCSNSFEMNSVLYENKEMICNKVSLGYKDVNNRCLRDCCHCGKTVETQYAHGDPNTSSTSLWELAAKTTDSNDTCSCLETCNVAVCTSDPPLPVIRTIAASTSSPSPSATDSPKQNKNEATSVSFECRECFITSEPPPLAVEPPKICAYCKCCVCPCDKTTSPMPTSASPLLVKQSPKQKKNVATSVICECRDNFITSQLLPSIVEPSKICTFCNCCACPDEKSTSPMPTSKQPLPAKEMKKRKKNVGTSVICECPENFLTSELPPSAEDTPESFKCCAYSNKKSTCPISTSEATTLPAKKLSKRKKKLATPAICECRDNSITLNKRNTCNVNDLGRYCSNQTQTNPIDFQQQATGTNQHQCQQQHDLLSKAVQNKYSGEILCIHNPKCILINGCLNFPIKSETPDTPVTKTTKNSKVGSIFRRFRSKSKIKVTDQSCQNESPYYGDQKCQTSNSKVNKLTQSNFQHHNPCCADKCRGPKMKTIFICDSCMNIPACMKRETTVNPLMIENSQIRHANKNDATNIAITEGRKKRSRTLTAKANINAQISQKYIPAEDLCGDVPLCHKEGAPVCYMQDAAIKLQQANDEQNDIMIKLQHARTKLHSNYEPEIPLRCTEYLDFSCRDTNDVCTLGKSYNSNMNNYQYASECSNTSAYAESIKKNRNELKELDTILEVGAVSKSNLRDNFTSTEKLKKEEGILAKFSQEMADDRYCVHVPMCRKVPRCLAKSKKLKHSKHSKKTKDTNLAHREQANGGKKYFVALTPRQDFCMQVAKKEITTHKTEYVCRHQPPCVKIPKCLGEVVKDSLIPLEDIPDCVHYPFCELIPACCREPKVDVKSVASQCPGTCRIT